MLVKIGLICLNCSSFILGPVTISYTAGSTISYTPPKAVIAKFMSKN